MSRPLVLASTSRYRHELLARLDLEFIAAAPDFDERAEDPHFAELGADNFALRLARGKAALQELTVDRILLANAEQQDCATAHAGITHR